jgi:hypothetical protein
MKKDEVATLVGGWRADFLTLPPSVILSNAWKNRIKVELKLE